MTAGRPLPFCHGKGPLAGLNRWQFGRGEAYDAIARWTAANQRESAGYTWEIYGDPTPDPAHTETTVVQLLRG